jgi:hypothetical protein
METEEAQPRVVQSDVECEELADLPQLPVRVLVLAADGEGPDVAKALRGVADALGAGLGVQVEDLPVASWRSLPSLAGQRFDAVFFRPDPIPPAPDDPAAPSLAILGALGLLLRDVGARLWVLAPPAELSEGEPERRRALCLRLLARGAPPSVLVPESWTAAEQLGFAEQLFEKLLADAPLVKAVGRASAERDPKPELYLPAGRRHGLDLGRLLEDHRQRIGSLHSELKSFRMEIEAFASVRDVEGHRERNARRTEDIDGIRQAAEEIDRDRDPAGWTRLAYGIERLAALEVELNADRDDLRAPGAPAS